MSNQEDQYGALFLIIGDLHVPTRVPELSQKLKSLLPPNKFATVLCTGNIGSQEALNWIRSLSPNTIIVKGDFEDQKCLPLPEQKIVQIKHHKVGLIHGHQIIPYGCEQSLLTKAKQLNVSVLISGNTHQLKVSQLGGVTFLNPGSLTASYSPLRSQISNSFMILQCKSRLINVYGYELIDGELKVGKYEIGNKDQ